MRPGADAVELEIIRIGKRAPLHLVGLLHPVGDALALGVGYGLLLGVEPQAHLLVRVAGRGPAHQGLDLAGLVLFENQEPLLGAGQARLVGGFGRLVDSRGHGS